MSPAAGDETSGLSIYEPRPTSPEKVLNHKLGRNSLHSRINNKVINIIIINQKEINICTCVYIWIKCKLILFIANILYCEFLVKNVPLVNVISLFIWASTFIIRVGVVIETCLEIWQQQIYQHQIILLKKEFWRSFTTVRKLWVYKENRIYVINLLYLDTKKIGTEVLGELRNVVLEENGEDKMVKESNKWTSYWSYRREEDTSK